MYRNAMEGETAAETARNAAKLRVAEAEERTQLAKKAAAEAEGQKNERNSPRKRRSRRKRRRQRLTTALVYKLVLRPRRKRKRKICGRKTKSFAVSRTVAATVTGW